MALRTAAQKAQDYMALEHSVALIDDAVRAGSDTAEKLRDTVSRNVAHLELMVALEDWGDEDMTACNAAITNGKAYVAV
tara:strand:- start:295 stop:531 length:237 start_codon:yes stop_codon:yes gene_type:complete